MIIKQIKLKNFRQFKDEHIIEFSTDKKKNVSVILGSNTSGKTTIVAAFIWCLYGDNTLKSPNMLLNNNAATLLTSNSYKEVSVEITLQHEKNEYIILRTQQWQKTSTGDGFRGQAPELKVSYIDKNGETNPVNPLECQNVIESILPKSLADYFFFDGERIKKINNKGNVVNAVRGLMGLDVYSAGMNHLDPDSSKSVIGKFKKELDTGKDVDAARRKAQIETYKEKLEINKERKSKIEKEIEHFQYEKERYAHIMKENEDVKKSQEDKEKLENEVKYFERTITSNEESFLLHVNAHASKFFALPLIKKGLEILNNAKEEGEGIPNMHASSIEFILKRGKCICGCDLTKNQGAVECIQHEQSLLPPHHIGTSIRMFKKDMQNASSIASLYADNIKRDYNNWLESESQLEYKQKELKEISEKIKGLTDVRRIEEKYQNASDKLNKFIQEKEQIKTQIIDLQARISENENEISKLFATNNKNRKIMMYCNYAQAVYEWLKSYYDEQEKIVKDELLKSINENFAKMYHGSRIITMDNNYKITPVTTDSKVELAKSEGLETVTNFSFIMGLVDLARKRANAANANDVNKQKVTEPYPIVMDAPFSNTDTKHIENITARLPQVAEQVIIFVMDKDWDIAEKELGQYLGSKYTIEKVDNKEDHSILRREI